MAEVKMKFTADTAQATKGIKEVKGSLDRLKSVGTSVGAGMKKAFVALGAGLTTVSAAALAGTKDIIDFAGEIKDIADSTGTSIKELIILREQFRQAGVDSGRLQAALTTLNSKLQNPSPATLEWLEQLGLSSEALLEMDPAARFEAVGKAIGNVSDSAKSLAASKDLFGKLGADLNRMFKDTEGKESAIRMLGQLPNTMQLIGGTLESAGDKFEGVSIKLKQFFAGFASQLLDPIEKAANTIETIDLSNLGVRAGMYANAVAESFKQGTLIDVLSQAFAAAWLKGTMESITILTYIIGKAVYGGFQWAMDKIPLLKQMSAAGTTLGANNRYSVGFNPNMQSGLDLLTGNFTTGLAGLLTTKNSNYSQETLPQYGEFRDFVNTEVLGGLNEMVSKLLAPLNTLAAGQFKMPQTVKLDEAGAAKIREEMAAALAKQREQEAARQQKIEIAAANKQNLATSMAENMLGFAGLTDFANEAFAKREDEKVEAAYQKGLDPIVSTLGKLGGARGETGANVVNFQNQSLKYQREIAINTGKMVGGATFA